MKSKKFLANLLIFSGVAVFLATSQAWLGSAVAKISSYLVRFPSELDFGVVFPQEDLDRNYEISFSNDIDTKIEFEYPVEKTVGEEYEETVKVTHGDSVKYGVAEERKELPGGYEGTGDPDMPGYYRDLCPHISSANGEGEGDLETSAFLSSADSFDLWDLDFLVPPIEGFVAADEIGLVLTVPVADDYGCDLAVEELGQTTTLRVDLPEACLEFVSGSAVPSETAYDPGGEVITWNFSEVYYGDVKEVKLKVRGIAECSATTTGVTYDDGINTTTHDGVEDIVSGGGILGAAAGGGEILGLATGGNLIYSLLASLAMISSGFYLRRRIALAKQSN